jgi:hypothetical protein
MTSTKAKGESKGKSGTKGKSAEAHERNQLPDAAQVASFAGLDANTVQAVYDAIHAYREQGSQSDAQGEAQGED